MARKKQVRIGDWVFETQTEAYECCSKLLGQYRLGQRIEDDVAIEFLQALVRRHPEADTKVGCGVAFFFVDNDGFGGRCFYLSRIDGSTTDFSFRSCVKAPTASEEALAALRSEISDQTQVFKRKTFEQQPVRCALTGVLLEWGNSHVDHVVEFDTLVCSFLEQEHVVLESLKVRPTQDGVTSTWLLDRELARRWSDYHRDQAVLRVVSAEANLRRKKSR